MFTGIVAAVGRIVSVEPWSGSDQAGMRVWIDAPALDLSDVALGDSIAVQGACMTVVALEGSRFALDVSRESLRRTVGLDAPGEVNLEKALRLADRLGGHLVSGHVDGLAEVVHFEPVGESWELRARVPSALGRYLAYKGSVTLDGVSLTVNQVSDVGDRDSAHRSLADGSTEISINLIPHTLQVTTLKRLRPGDRVNLEVDLIARYLERLSIR